MKDARAQGLAQWARNADLKVHIPDQAILAPVSDDASFRRYFRFDSAASGIVFVDAPPSHEDNESFIKVSLALGQAGLHVPHVLAVDLDLGYLAVTDLGDRVYLHEMVKDPACIASLYDKANDALMTMIAVDCDLPPYNHSRLMTEMSLFHEWFLAKQLNIAVSEATRVMLTDVYDFLAGSALAQPTGFVHRDYHCRNLMVAGIESPGSLDFQDAVVGPITYDLVSLYKDCYFRFERDFVIEQVEKFNSQLIDTGIVGESTPLLRWFDLMGAQRHLKCAGIFSRLNLRDGKPGYLSDIPLVIDYLIETAGLYSELAEFHTWLLAVVYPKLQNA